MLYPSIYGFLIAIAIFVCLQLAEQKAKKDNMKAHLVWNIGLTGLLSGIIGARAYHVVDYWEYYSLNTSLIFQVWHGGLGIWGGIVGAISGLYVYLKTNKIENIRYWFDLFALYLPLGQAVGRWGNYFNQENFGQPTNLPWKIYIEPKLRPQNYQDNNFYHPLFLYESLLSLALFFVLLSLEKKFKVGMGYIINFYLIGYSVIRFCLEFLRIEPWEIQGINTAQSMSTIFFIFSVYSLIARAKRA